MSIENLYIDSDKKRPRMPIDENVNALDLGLTTPTTTKDISEWEGMVFAVAGKCKKTKLGGNSIKKSFVCTGCKCELKLRCSQVTSKWYVHDYTNSEHIDCVGIRKLSSKNAFSLLDGTINCSTSSKRVIEQGRGQNILITKEKASKLRKMVAANFRAPFSEGSSRLRSYLHVLKQQNPGSTITLETEICNEDDIEVERFSWLFIQLAAQVELTCHCRPIMSYDCGHLKNPLWSHFVVMVACTSDGNHRDVLSSISICSVENTKHVKMHIEAQMSDPRIRECLQQEGIYFVILYNYSVGAHLLF